MPQGLALLLVVTQIRAAEQAAAPQAAPSPQTSAPQANPNPAQQIPAQSSPAQQNPGPASSPAQQTAPAPIQPVASLPTEESLKILVLAGKGESNDLERKVMSPMVIQVLDQNDRPIEGAEVVFRFPINGPGASFPGGKSSLTVRTNTGGQAAALNWMANSQTGPFDVHVTASYGNQIGETTFSMTNVTRVVEEPTKAKAESLWSHRWFKIAVIGGAAVAVGLGVYFGTRGGSKSSGSTVSISPGSPTVGAP